MFHKTSTRKPTRTNLSVLAQLCNLIPGFLTAKLAREFGVDKKARTFSPWSHLVALLLYLLLRFLAFVNGWQHGLKRFFCLLRSSVWDGVPVASLASFCGTAGGLPAMRAAPEQLYLPGFGPREMRA